MKLKDIISNFLWFLFIPLSLIFGVIVIVLSGSVPIIALFGIGWAIENWRISLPILIIICFGVFLLRKILDYYESKKREIKFESERRAACEFCKTHPELVSPIRHSVLSFKEFCRSYYKWDKYGRAYIKNKAGEQPCVVVYDIEKGVKINSMGYAKKSINSYEIPIFNMESDFADETLVNLEDSDIIRIETSDQHTHIFINPKPIPLEEAKTISRSIFKQAQNLCKSKSEKNQKDSKKVFLLFQEAAQLGDVEAQCCLGCCYRNGYGTQVDHQKAKYWYDMSSNRGYTRALRHIAITYEEGQGVPQSYEKAAEWYFKAAEQNDTKAQYQLGYCFLNGRGVPQNYEKAIEWYSMAADQGHAGAQYFIGCCYERGHVFPKSYEKSVEWYTKAAGQGHVDAQVNLGRIFYCGIGVPQNYEKAAEWYSKAAAQGDAIAQCSLGFFYERGKCFPKSHEKAVEWYTKAAEQGNNEAQKQKTNIIHKRCAFWISSVCINRNGKRILQENLM